MKKIKSVSFVVLMALVVGLCATVLAGCGEVTISYTVYNEDRSEILVLNRKDFEKNETFEVALDEIKGYDFDGWYLDPECTEKFDTENTKLTEPFDLFGRYVLKEYTVKFILDGEETATQKVKHGEYATPPELEKEGHEIEYWYKNKECTETFWFDDNQIEENKTLYAAWSKIKIRFECYIDGKPAFGYHIGDLKYGDPIKECTEIIENQHSDVYSDGWFLDKEYTKPIDVNTYKIGVNDVFYWRTRINVVQELGLEKLPDGTFAITKECFGYRSKYMDEKTKIVRIPDSFKDREGNEQIISTIRTGAFPGARRQAVFMFGKNIVNVEEHAFGTNSKPEFQEERFAVFFENEYSKMNLADNIVFENTQTVSGVAIYYGETYEINEEFIYQNTGSDIVILKYIGGQETLVIPETIDGVPVTKINSAAIGVYLSDTICYLRDNIKTVLPGAFFNAIIYCTFDETGASGFSQGWKGEGSEIHYNATIPPELLG